MIFQLVYQNSGLSRLHSTDIDDFRDAMLGVDAEREEQLRAERNRARMSEKAHPQTEARTA
jgi:hypothetical protein